MIYISDGTWFDKGTECYKIEDYENGTGLYFGLHNGENDEELCQDKEFITKENN